MTHRRSYSWTPRGLLVSDARPWPDPEAIPFLEPSPQPSEQESSLILQCLWSRSIIAIIASLSAIAQNKETAISIMQAIKASAALATLTVPRDHVFLQSPELAACIHDSAFHMCPSPHRGEVLLASTRMPTWPCPDSELLALEALSRVSNLPLRLGNLAELTYASLLRTSGPFVAHRPPICDGAGAPSSADHSLPNDSGLSKASQAWLHWARKSNLSKRVFAHISQSRPDHPLSQEEQSEALAVLCSALNLDHASMATVSPGQPFRLVTRAHAGPSPAHRRPRFRPATHASRRSSHGRLLRNKALRPLATSQATASSTVRPGGMPRQLASSRRRPRHCGSPPRRRRSRQAQPSESGGQRSSPCIGQHHLPG